MKILNLLYIHKLTQSIRFSFMIILESERSDECIDFTMMCVFFVSVYSNVYIQS